MLKDKIENVRKKIIHLLGGYTDIVRTPEQYTVTPVTIMPQHINEWINIPVKSFPPEGWTKRMMAEKLATQLVNNHVVKYTFDQESDCIIVHGRIVIINDPPQEGETTDVEEVMEKIRMHHPWA